MFNLNAIIGKPKPKLEYKKLLQDVGVPVGEEDECMAWAFGEKWKELPLENYYIAWNKRHRALFLIREWENHINNIKNAGVAYEGIKTDGFLKMESLSNLNDTEALFRKLLIKGFKRENIHDPNEMMDCLSWGLGYNEELLRCHTYWKWPDEFFKNTGILVNNRDPVVKCIRLLTRKWKSKRKYTVVRKVSHAGHN